MKTFEETVKDAAGTIYEDWFDGGVRCIIMRGPVALCAYLGVPEDHPLAGTSYDDLPLRCHGGLTFSEKGGGKWHPAGFWWFGWDYAHAGDFCFYDLKQGAVYSRDKKWTVDEVRAEVSDVLWDFKKLVKLAETTKVKALATPIGRDGGKGE